MMIVPQIYKELFKKQRNIQKILSKNEKKNLKRMEETVKERLMDFIKSKKIPVSRFEKSIGVSIGYIANMRRSLQPDKISRIVDVYPELNIAWLLTGVGEMVEGGGEQPSKGVSYRLVPLYNLDARGGFGTNDEVDVPEYVVDRIPFQNAHTGDICIPVSGDSMAPAIPSGSIVLLREVMRSDGQFYPEYGKVFVLILKDGRRILKVIRKGSSVDTYMLLSENEAYDPMEIPISIVSRLWQVIAVYSRVAL